MKILVKPGQQYSAKPRVGHRRHVRVLRVLRRKTAQPVAILREVTRSGGRKRGHEFTSFLHVRDGAWQLSHQYRLEA